MNKRIRSPIIQDGLIWFVHRHFDTFSTAGLFCDVILTGGAVLKSQWEASTSHVMTYTAGKAWWIIETIDNDQGGRYRVWYSRLAFMAQLTINMFNASNTVVLCVCVCVCVEYLSFEDPPRMQSLTWEMHFACYTFQYISGTCTLLFQCRTRSYRSTRSGSKKRKNHTNQWNVFWEYQGEDEIVVFFF